ncbi:hypothetical protein [Fluviispira vulneris]|uniref:hypothetical protein n=1 Tax=Fluviispira vulneris TaxID=2763012 RepID=UPI001643FD1A|nr:hypothetical protein [Fluviispira vulneris]
MKKLFCSIILSCFPFTVSFADEGINNADEGINNIAQLEPIVLDHFGTPLQYCNTYSMGTADIYNASTSDGIIIPKNSLFGFTKYLARTIYESKRATGFVQFLSAQNIPCDREIREKDFIFINLKNSEQTDSYFVKMDDNGIYFPIVHKESISNKDHIFQFIKFKNTSVGSAYALQYISSHSSTFLTCQGLNFCESTDIPSQALLIRFLPVKSGVHEKAHTKK